MSSSSAPIGPKKRTRSSAVSPKKKQNVAAEPFKWSCIVCFAELGEKGVVPVVLRDCFPNAHTLCLACAHLMNINKGGGVLRVKCPTCRSEACDAAILSDFVDETSDSIARARIAATVYMQSDYTTQKIMAIARAEAISEQANLQNLRNARLQVALKLVHQTITSSVFTNGTRYTMSRAQEVPEFDKARVRMAKLGDADFEENRATSESLAKAVWVDLMRVYKDTVFKVEMHNDQCDMINGVKTVVYMRMRVSLRKPTTT